MAQNRIFLISDLHAGTHNNRTQNIRGFKSWEEHDECVLENINSTANKKSDILYILGDLGYKDDKEGLKTFISKIIAQKFVSFGNHDNPKQIMALKASGIICDAKPFYKLKYKEDYIFMSHFPHREWENFYKNGYHAFGHCHGNMEDYLRSSDVGIDHIGYRPIHIEEFINKLKSKNNIDKYGKRINN